MRSKIVLGVITGIAVIIVAVVEVKQPTLLRWRCGPVYSDNGFQRSCGIEPAPRLKALLRARNRPDADPSRPPRSTRHAPS